MENEYIVKLLETRQVTHDVKQFHFEKPRGYSFVPGQATDMTINKPGWKDKKNPFTFTGYNDDPFLQFTIKRYPDHHGVTDQLHQLKPGETVIVHDVWGAIEYRGTGVFLAGGAGITPFLAIFRQLYRENKARGNTLYFSNKTAGDVIEHQELLDILGVGANFILSNDNTAGYLHTRIDKAFLQSQITDFKQPFYICGPDQMVKDLADTLQQLGASPEAVVFEK
ncbi:FAD-binding oxidoreductase [Puia sp.]|uniref:FAD-binding oxidoreductase n=1 Tax=Puia sp. TaxID=2045100 RepID=UPI002F424567